jgi:hypothetical protein
MRFSPKEMMRRVAQPTRLILALTMVIVAASVVVALIVVSGDDATGAPAGPDSDAPSEATDSIGSNGDNSRETSSPGGVAAAEAGDSIGAAVAEACEQFRSGATVAEFALWFEADWGGGDAGTEETFREVIEQALTEECPEVVPSD